MSDRKCSPILIGPIDFRDHFQMTASTFDQARTRFFNETGNMMPPFRNSEWRGCALNRDNYDNTRLPRLLFDSITQSAKVKTVTVIGYDARSDVNADWDAYRSYMLTTERWSLEYVIHDQSGQWALLCDPDATILGASPEIADGIDSFLALHGTGLIKLTDSDFPNLNPATQPGARYLLAASGR